MASPIFPKAAVTTINTTSQSVGNATQVYLYNNTGAAVVVTRHDAANTAIGSFLMGNAVFLVVKKEHTDLLSCAAGNMAATKIGETN